MANQSRRDFLKWTAAAGSAAALGPVGLSAAAQTPLAMVIARSKAAPTTEADIEAMAAKLTQQSIATLGGMKRFVKKGDTVWVKPNIGWDRTPELAANTNPAVVGMLVKLCYEAGAGTVKVGDLPCNPAEKTYVNSGIAAAAKKAGAEVVYLDKSRFREIDLGGRVLRRWPICPEVIKSDLVINVPIAKNHNISTITACMKNYMGIADRRNIWHQSLPACLCDMTRFMKPRLCVLDAVRILVRNGPTGGNPADVVRKDTVAAGTDIVALDALAAELLGRKPEDVATVAAGQAAKLGTMDYRSLALKEIVVT